MNPPRKYNVIPDAQFNRLTVIQEDLIYRSNGRTERAAFCVCTCGNFVTVDLNKLFSGHTTSCGCLHREVVREMGKTFTATLTHGLYHHPLYQTHLGMIDRCYDTKSKDYKNYGGRGITVCERWYDVRSFVEDIERELGPRPPGWTLDRINNDGNYTSGNVQWATWSMQNRNQRQTRQRNELGRYVRTPPDSD